jgi:hypothetical protein
LLTWSFNNFPATWAELITPTHVVSVVVPVVLVIVGLAAALGVYIYRHQRLQHSFVSFANSHYDTRSGAATFTGGEGLGKFACQYSNVNADRFSFQTRMMHQ